MGESCERYVVGNQARERVAVYMKERRLLQSKLIVSVYQNKGVGILLDQWSEIRKNLGNGGIPKFTSSTL